MCRSVDVRPSMNADDDIVELERMTGSGLTATNNGLQRAQEFRVSNSHEVTGGSSTIRYSCALLVSYLLLLCGVVNL
jgi:hypothetical protein